MPSSLAPDSLLSLNKVWTQQMTIPGAGPTNLLAPLTSSFHPLLDALAMPNQPGSIHLGQQGLGCLVLKAV